MKILFGVQGTGNGHISRSRELVRKLREDGHDVDVIISGRKAEELKEVEIFEPFRVMKGMTLVSHKGKMSYIDTMIQLDLARLMADVALLDTAGTELVITDFDPVTSMAARVRNIPSMGFGHQYAFGYDIPLAQGNILAKFILMNFAPARYNAGLHWHHFNQPIFPPVIPPSLYEKNAKLVIKGKVLVYLPFEEIEDITVLMTPFDQFEFYIYGKVSEDRDDGHLHFRTYSRSGFLDDLLECDGVVCNAGFELPGEALHLGKKLLLRPLDGQIEQESNALAMEELGYGMAMHDLDGAVLADWLQRPCREPLRYAKSVDFIAEWIGSGHWEELPKYAAASWSGNFSH
ncbi:MJ1255/VC2487 family glycosyltransferase [Chlorobium sp. KB01]|uniref:MJ1255/VC2487 family glycosyltransferase n=1 Tax=Chlorobium sp. KB01 TaxID=1917528 RepID=UPI0009781D74|nr:MJ1255/VC2487 family glycosyltransferase [Chlorobium sp. KB01]